MFWPRDEVLIEFDDGVNFKVEKNNNVKVKQEYDNRFRERGNGENEKVKREETIPGCRSL